MKILFVCGAGYVYGKEMVTLSLMRGLRDRGHDVRCLTSTWNDGDFVRRLEGLSIPYEKIPLGFISKKISWPAMRMTLDQVRKLPALWLGYSGYLRKFSPDVILHTNFHHLVLLWPLLGRGKEIFHVHDRFAATRFYRVIFKLISVRLRFFVGVSSFIAQSLIELGVEPNKVRYVLNGAAIEDLTVNDNGKAVSSRGGVNGKLVEAEVPFTLGIVGQVGEWKGHDDLIEALRILKLNGRSFVCRIYGDGNLEFAAKLKRKVASYDLSENVQWVGFLNDKGAIYNELDVCVVPSRISEAFGVVAAEAALSGVPVIASRLGGLPEIVQDNETGFLFEPGAVDQLAEKIAILMCTPELRRSMGLAARKYALNNLAPTRMVEHMVQLFI